MLNIIQILAALISTATSALTLAQQVSDKVAKAHAEGRTLTEADLHEIEGLDDAARALLATAIAKSQAAAVVG